MLLTMLALAAGLTQPATAAPVAVAVPAGRTLKDVPNTTISYFDVAGRNGAAIEKSLKKILADPAAAQSTRLFNYDVKAQIMKSTTGTVCTVTNAKATLTPTVHLPRLAEQAKVDKQTLAAWQTYVSGLEADAAANLWFIADRLPAIEQSVVGKSCDQANPTWNAGLESLRTQVSAYNNQRVAAAAAAAAAAKKNKADVKISDD